MNKSYTLANWDGGLSAFANNSQEPAAGPLVLTPFKDSQLHSYPNASGTAKPVSSPHNDTTTNGYLDEMETTVQSGKLSVNGHQEFSEASFTSTESSEVAQVAPKLNISAAPTIQDVAPHASNLLQTPNLAFVPIANSPLHQKFTPRTRKPPSTDANTRSTPVRTLQPLGENSRSSPRDPDVMSEPLSLGTADAEGEDENEDLLVVDLQSFSPSRAEHSEQNTAQSSHSGRDSLFTPPPSDEMIPVERLFTPEPPRRRASNHERPRVIPRTPSPPRPRLIMSHIEVPPLRRPKSDYVRLSSLVENRVRPIAPVKKPNRPAHGPTSLRDALQAAWQNNLELGTEPVPEQYAIWKKKKKKKKERREEHINATAGPSKLVTSSVSSSINMQPKVFKYKRPRKERDQFDGSEKTAKRRRITIDLTLSDDDRAQTSKYKPLLTKQPKPPPPPPPPPHVQTKPTQSTPCLTSDVITPIPSNVLVFNTRFIWKKCGKENVDSPSPGIAPWSLSSSRKRACICTVDDYSLSLFDEEEVEISIGGTVGTVWDEDFRQPAEGDYDSDDSSVVVLESLPREPAQPVPPPSHPKPPKKIDLAERIRKKKGKEKQVSKIPSPLSKKQRQLHSQLQPTSSAAPSAFSTASSYQASTIYVRRHGIAPSTPNNPISVQEDPSTATSFPSAKSLGKRKAVSPPPLSTPFIYPLKPHSSSLPAPSRYNANLDVFMYPYDSPLCSPHSASFSHLGAFANCTRSGSAASEEQVDSVLNQPHSISPSSPDVYPASSAIVQKTLTETPPILHNFHRAQTGPEYPWASLADHDAAALGYGFDTIDPTLLGGEPVVEIESQSQAQRSWAYGSSAHTPDTPSSSSSASSSSSSSFASLSSRAQSFQDLQEEDTVSTATTTPDGPEVEIEGDRATNAGVDARYTTETAEGRPRRNAKPRRMIDMVSIDQVDVLADPTTSEYRSSSASVEESSDEEPSMVIVPRRHPAPMAVQKSIQVNRAAVEVKKGVPTKNRRKNWPTTKTDSSCHQCRTRNFLVKMSCLGCAKLYCVRCLAMRYPDEEFDPSQVTPGCPACEGYCNCTICCQRRGVQYISSRKQAKNTSLDDVVPANQPIRRTTLGGKTNLPPPVVLQQLQPQPPPLPSNAVYWGTVYDLSGKRIGRSYFDPKAATSHVHIEEPASSVPFVPRTSATTAKRVFIGKVQRLWGLGRHPKVCELNPPARAKKLSARREARQYIGDKKFLSYRFDAEASSLSSVEEDESDGAGGAEEQMKAKDFFA